MSHPHPSPSWFLQKGWKNRKFWWFHSNYTNFKWLMILSRMCGQQLIKESNWLKPMTFFQKAHSTVKFNVNKNLSLFFSKSLLYYSKGVLSYFVSKLLFLFFPLHCWFLFFSHLHHLCSVGPACVGFAQTSFGSWSTYFWRPLAEMWTNGMGLYIFARSEAILWSLVAFLYATQSEN